MDLRRAAASNLGRSRRSELVGLCVMFGVAASVLGIVFVKMPSFPFGLGFATSLTFSILSAYGVGRDRRRVKLELSEIARAEAERARLVTEYQLAADRVLVAAGAGGEGDVWWFFRTDDGKWLVFQSDQWEDIDPSARTWNRDVRVGVDNTYAVVSVTSSGAPITVERRDLQPPDFVPTPDTLFWSPPDDLGALPAVIATDPTAPGADGSSS